jgi:hypothetical protein
MFVWIVQLNVKHAILQDVIRANRIVST